MRACAVQRAGDLRADVAVQVLPGMAPLHARGIAHRDVKLEDVLCAVKSLSALGVRLSDFGFGKSAQFPVGTPVYVAPGSARGEAHGEPSTKRR